MLQHCNAVYNQNSIDRWTKGCILPFHRKGDLRISKNYRGITLTSTAAKVYNALLCNCRELKIENILKKNPNSFQRNWSMTSQIYRSNSRRCMCKKPRSYNIIRWLFQCLWLYTQRKDGANTSHLWPPQRNCHSHTEWRDRLFWHCSRCATRRHISPISIYHLPRLCHLNVERLMKENGFKLAKASISMQTRRNTCALIKEVTSPH